MDTVSVTVASDLGVSATTANNWFSYGLISSKGYLLVSAKGDVYRFGDAHLYGSLGDRRLRSPIVAFATTPSSVVRSPEGHE